MPCDYSIYPPNWLSEIRPRILARANNKCEVCGNVMFFQDSQLAHRICKSKMHLKKYGKEIIHHSLNLALVCGLECNSAVNIGNNPMEVEKLIKRIEDSLRG